MKKTIRRWTDEEVAILKEHANEGAAKIAERLGRSPSAVTLKAFSLKVALGKNSKIEPSEPPAPREGIGVVPAQEDIATPEELAAEPSEVSAYNDDDRSFGHCDHVEECVANPTCTDCGADPCNLVEKAMADKEVEEGADAFAEAAQAEERPDWHDEPVMTVRIQVDRDMSMDHHELVDTHLRLIGALLVAADVPATTRALIDREIEATRKALSRMVTVSR